MASPALNDVLLDVQNRLPGTTWIEAEVPLDDLTVEVQGGPEMFTRAVTAAGATLLFYELSPLTDAQFAHVEDDEDRPLTVPLVEMAALKPFRKYLGQPWLLRTLFLHAGHRIEWHQHAEWWPKFLAAREVALTQHEEAQERLFVEGRARRQAESARRVEVLREVLPEDPAFIALACEARPRITAMRQRADEVLEERLGGGSVSGLEDPVLRELAQQLREQHKRRR